MLARTLVFTSLLTGCFIKPDEQFRPAACVLDDFTTTDGTCGGFGDAMTTIGNHEMVVKQGLTPGGCHTPLDHEIPFTAGGVFVEVVHAPVEGLLSLSLGDAPGPELVIDETVAPPMLVFAATQQPTLSLGTIAYDAAAMRWLRLRPDDTHTHVLGEYGRDGVHWTAIPPGEDVAEYDAATNTIQVEVDASGTDDAHAGVVRELDACPAGVE